MSLADLVTLSLAIAALWLNYRNERRLRTLEANSDGGYPPMPEPWSLEKRWRGRYQDYKRDWPPVRQPPPAPPPPRYEKVS